jgi:pimeloyl-ACP methyl ester carboxylesterase
LEEDQQRDHLLLTDVGTKRYVETKKSGHWVHITEPELVVGEILNMIGYDRLGDEQTDTIQA